MTTVEVLTNCICTLLLSLTLFCLPAASPTSLHQIIIVTRIIIIIITIIIIIIIVMVFKKDSLSKTILDLGFLFMFYKGAIFTNANDCDVIYGII